MAKQTLGSFFRELQQEQGLSGAEIGRRCGFDQSTPSNIGRNRPIQWETVHLALTAGLKIKASSEPYKRCHELWLKQRADRAASHPPDFGAKTLSKHATEVVRKFRNLVRDLDPEQAKKVFLAAQRAARGL